MIYAIRTTGRRETLVELEKEEELSSLGDSHRRVSRSAAARWVTDGKEHETGLFVDDDGMVVYAPKEG